MATINFHVFALAIASVLFLSACEPKEALPEKVGTFPTPSSPEGCKAVRGEWVIGTKFVPSFCIVPTADHGKTCNDNNDCAAFCVADPAAEKGKRGICSSTYEYKMTCLDFYDDGDVKHVCFD
jgi:hypothetical protein